MELYKLQPACADYLWGGTKLKERWNKKSEKLPLAESWELSVHEAGKSLVASGPRRGTPLADLLTKADWGENAQGFEDFPIMIKLIDAAQNLSVQVHPDDAYALVHEGGPGKTEMWYILEAEEGAGIYCGLKERVTPKEYTRHIEEGTVTTLLNFYAVRPGECYFIPAGTVHAIGAGAVILEIQQNSNLTYRVYDYNRRDAQGNLRELHIEKARTVSKLEPSAPKAVPKEHGPGMRQLAASRYFSAYEYTCEEPFTFTVDGRSFAAVTFVEGGGSIGGQPFEKGDSFFAPAGLGEITVAGKSRFVLTKLVKYYVGIDLGGTDIKGAVIDEDGRFMAKRKTASETHRGSEQVIANIAALITDLLTEAGLTIQDTEGIGIGIPGTVDGQTGRVDYSNNLKWRDIPIVELLKQCFDTTIKITNDANAAAIGEMRFGAGRQYTDAVLLTLGTGLGSGIVIGGRLFVGNCSAGAELGHMVIRAGGELCTCGRRGCFEAYASATALVREARKAAQKDKNSEMWRHLKDGNIKNMNARIPFDCRHTDKAAARVVEDYIENLAEGMANVVNMLRPQAIMVGGGVSNEGEGLLTPLRKRVMARAFGGAQSPRVEIVTAKLGNDAGVYGAAALLMSSG